MVRIYCRIVVMEIIFLCTHCVHQQNIGVVVPWLGPVDINGPSMGSSFFVAMKDLEYNEQFALMPLSCEENLSVMTQV